MKILGKYRGNDVELCETTNASVSDRTVKALMEEHIPFTKNYKRIPFFRREDYEGAEAFWVIKVNARRYSQARRTLDRLDRSYRERLVMSNF